MGRRSCSCTTCASVLSRHAPPRHLHRQHALPGAAATTAAAPSGAAAGAAAPAQVLHPASRRAASIAAQVCSLCAPPGGLCPGSRRRRSSSCCGSCRCHAPLSCSGSGPRRALAESPPAGIPAAWAPAPAPALAAAAAEQGGQRAGLAAQRQDPSPAPAFPPCRRGSFSCSCARGLLCSQPCGSGGSSCSGNSGSAPWLRRQRQWRQLLLLCCRCTRAHGAPAAARFRRRSGGCPGAGRAPGGLCHAAGHQGPGTGSKRRGRGRWGARGRGRGAGAPPASRLLSACSSCGSAAPGPAPADRARRWGLSLHCAHWARAALGAGAL